MTLFGSLATFKTSRGASRAYTVAFVMFLFSQVLQFSPGVDVSPWAFAHIGVRPNSFLGLSIQTWAGAFLGVVCLTGSLNKRATFLLAHKFVLGSLGVVIISSLVMTGSIQPVIDNLGQVVIPVLSYIYLSSLNQLERRDYTSNLMMLACLFTVLQVLVSKLYFGAYAAHNYYYELEEEYFGFFHHPFAFVGVLGICAIVLLFVIVERKFRFSYIILFVVCNCLIVLTQVRTYLVAVVVGLVVGCCLILLSRRKLVILFVAFPLMLAIVLYLGRDIVGAFASDRANTDLSSGRLERWATDLSTFLDQASVPELFFGGGADRVHSINEQLVGVRISSLNFFVDTFINYGLIGLILLLSTLIIVLLDAARRGNKGLVMSLAVFLLVAAFITSPFEFPIVGVTLSIAMCSLPNYGGDLDHACFGTSSASVSRGTGEQ